MPQKYPKVLIVSRGAWVDNSGISSTLSNLFRHYDPDSLAQIYIETQWPDTRICNRFFQISEYVLIRKIYNKRVVAGKEIKMDEKSQNEGIIRDAEKEEKIMRFVRQNRSWIFNFAREILWLLNGWKSKELKRFINSFNPVVIFLDGSPLILMNRLHNFVVKQAKKPAIIFLMDDVYTYKSCGYNPMEYFYKFFLRFSVERVVKRCREIFVASPKMKREYDAIFNISSRFLTKGIDFAQTRYIPNRISTPVRIVYLGQIIYGRESSLITFVKVLKQINQLGIKAQLFIHTSNYVSKETRAKLELKDCSIIMPAVPYEEVSKVMADTDILLFVESMERKYRNLARLSFSTKITDYFSSGKCIFAIGEKNIAPIEYLKEQDAAIIACSESEIFNELTRLIDHPDLITEYSEKSFDCGRRNHDIKDIHALFQKTIEDLVV